MKRLVYVVAALGLAAGCKKKDSDDNSMAKTAPGPGSAAGSAAPAAPATPPKPATKTGKDLAQAYLDCNKFLDAGKFDDFRKTCLADSFVAHEAGEPDRKADDIIAMFKDIRAAFPDFKTEPQLVLLNGRTVFGIGLMMGTNSGAMKTPKGEMPATNKKIGVLHFHKLTLDDENKATEEWAYGDMRTMMGQLGVLPADAGTVRPALDKGWEGAPIVVVAADDAKEKANLETSKKMIDAFNAHKLKDEAAVLAKDVVESAQYEDADTKGVKDYQAATESMVKGFPDAKQEIGTWAAAGDYVVMLGTTMGTNTGPLGDMKPTKKAIKLDFANVLQLKDGKITNMWRFGDGSALLKQLGLMPDEEPAAPAEAPKAPEKAPPKKAPPKKK